MGEDGRAVALDVLVEADAGASLGQHGRERRPADFERIMTQVVAVQLDQVEGVEERVAVMPSVADAMKDATPLSSHATASPSMMQERERRRASVSMISGKRRLRSLPGRL
jgi:hypothetical protein